MFSKPHRLKFTKDDNSNDGGSRLVRTYASCIPSDSELPDPILPPVIVSTSDFTKKSPHAASGGGISCSYEFRYRGRKRLPRLDLSRLEILVSNLDQRRAIPLSKPRWNQWNHSPPMVLIGLQITTLKRKGLGA